MAMQGLHSTPAHPRYPCLQDMIAPSTYRVEIRVPRRTPRRTLNPGHRELLTDSICPPTEGLSLHCIRHGHSVLTCWIRAGHGHFPVRATASRLLRCRPLVSLLSLPLGCIFYSVRIYSPSPSLVSCCFLPSPPFVFSFLPPCPVPDKQKPKECMVLSLPFSQTSGTLTDSLISIASQVLSAGSCGTSLVCSYPALYSVYSLRYAF